VLNTNFQLAEYLFFDTADEEVLNDKEFRLISLALKKCLQFVNPLPSTSINGCPATSSAHQHHLKESSLVSFHTSSI
jgi:hypothetical protein